MKRKSLLFLLIVMFAVGCAGKSVLTKPVDIAAELGKQTSRAFLVFYSLAKDWTEKGTPLEQEFALTKLNPLLNKAKPVIADFNRMVAAWQMTGVAGGDVLEKQKELQTMYDEIQNLILDFVEMKEK